MLQCRVQSTQHKLWPQLKINEHDFKDWNLYHKKINQQKFEEKNPEWKQGPNVVKRENWHTDKIKMLTGST